MKLELTDKQVEAVRIAVEYALTFKTFEEDQEKELEAIFKELDSGDND